MGSWYRLELDVVLPIKPNEIIVQRIGRIESMLDDTVGKDFDPETHWIDNTVQPITCHVNFHAEFKLSGEEIEDVIDNACRAIWVANGEYCKIQPQWLYLEAVPWEACPRGEEDYKRLLE